MNALFILLGLAILILPLTVVLLIKELSKVASKNVNEILALVERHDLALTEAYASSRSAERDLQSRLLAMIGIHYTSLEDQRQVIDAMEKTPTPRPMTPEEEDIDWDNRVDAAREFGIGRGDLYTPEDLMEIALNNTAEEIKQEK